MTNTTSPNTSTETASASCKSVTNPDQNRPAITKTVKSATAKRFVHKSWRERLAPHAIPASTQQAT